MNIYVVTFPNNSGLLIFLGITSHAFNSKYKHIDKAAIYNIEYTQLDRIPCPSIIFNIVLTTMLNTPRPSPTGTNNASGIVY